MRGQPGPCLAPGNSPAARRHARRRKPPPIILWSIGIITCLLFIGAAAMLTVGYLNPFGTVGLAILGVGAVVYFLGIIFLVLSCLWVERKYPGMQPLSFKIYSRKPNRIPPTTFTNPNMSGQVPADTTPTYRIHNELPVQIPGFSDVGGTAEKIPCTSNDKPQEKNNNNNPPSHGTSQGDDKNIKIQSTEEDRNGGISEDGSHDIKLQALTNNDNVTIIGDTSGTGMKEKSQSQQEQNKHIEGAVDKHGVDQNKKIQHKQSENDNNVPTSPKKERKVRIKTHHIEVPFEDYPSSDSSTTLNNKDNSQDIQKSNPNEHSQQINSTTENDNLPTTGASKSTSPAKTSAMDKLKEASNSVNNLSHTRDTYLHQRTKAAAHSTNKDIKEEPSNVSNTQPTVHARTQIPQKHQNNQDGSQMVRELTSKDAELPSAVRKATEHESYAAKPVNPVQKDFAPKASPASDRKLLDGHKHNAANPDRVKESVQEKSQTSSLLLGGKNILPFNNTYGPEKQNKTTSPKDYTKKSDSQGGSPTRAQKMQSPDRARKARKGNAVSNSPQTSRKPNDSSLPPRHPQKKPDNFSTTQKTQEQSITIQTFSSSGKKEEIQKKKILHSSRSSDLPSSSSSSSSPKHRQRSPNKSPRLPRNGDHASRATSSYSSSKESAHRQSRHSSPSSQSSDVPSSPSSSPQRTRQKSPDLATKMQRHKHIPVTGAGPSSSNKKDELHKRHSQPSSQSSGVLPSPTSSPLTAKKLLQIKTEQTNQDKSVPQQRTNK